MGGSQIVGMGAIVASDAPDLARTAVERRQRSRVPLDDGLVVGRLGQAGQALVHVGVQTGDEQPQ